MRERLYLEKKNKGLSVDTRQSLIIYQKTGEANEYNTL